MYGTSADTLLSCQVTRAEGIGHGSWLLSWMCQSVFEALMCISVSRWRFIFASSHLYTCICIYICIYIISIIYLYLYINYTCQVYTCTSVFNRIPTTVYYLEWRVYDGFWWIIFSREDITATRVWGCVLVVNCLFNTYHTQVSIPSATEARYDGRHL